MFAQSVPVQVGTSNTLKLRRDNSNVKVSYLDEGGISTALRNKLFTFSSFLNGAINLKCLKMLFHKRTIERTVSLYCRKNACLMLRNV